jgi:hypothetical protein
MIYRARGSFGSVEASSLHFYCQPIHHHRLTFSLAQPPRSSTFHRFYLTLFIDFEVYAVAGADWVSNDIILTFYDYSSGALAVRSFRGNGSFAVERQRK